MSYTKKEIFVSIGIGCAIFLWVIAVSSLGYVAVHFIAKMW